MREKVQDLWLTVRRYWQRPKRGDEVAYKEIAAFSVGSMGLKGYGSLMTNYIQMAATCLLTGTVYGLSPTYIMILYIITNVVGVIKTPFVSMLIDNTNTPIGKFRPYVIWAGIPSVLALVGLTWGVPLDASPIVKAVLIGIFYNLLSIAQPLAANAQVGLSQVISSNSAERSRILGFSELLGNLGPSIIQLLLPSIGGIIYGDDAMTNIWTYRILIPIFGIGSLVMSLFALYFAQERAVVPRLKVNKIKFTEGMKILSKNREFWAVTTTRFFDTFKTSLVALLPWVCTYQLGKSSLLGITQTIVSVGFTPGIILAPLLISKLGTRKAGLTFCLANCLAALIMYFTFKQGFVFFVISLFIFNFADGPQYIIQTTIMSDGLDAQQDITGERIEGFAQNFQTMVTTIGGVLSTFLFTWVYESNGLVADPTTGETDYEILKDAAIREPIISTVILIAMAASFLAAMPYLLVRLDRKRMAVIRESLTRKKVIADAGLKDAPEEEQQAAYDAYLEEKEKEEERNKAIAEREKEELRKKNEERDAKIAAFKAKIVAFEQESRAKGVSEKDITKGVKAMRKEAKRQKAAESKEMFDKLRADQKELNRRRKAFCIIWIGNAKAEGKKMWLRVLAREAFSRKLAEESLKMPEEDQTASDTV